MKLFYTLLLLLTLAPVTIAQEIDEDEAEVFWEENIQPILDLDKDKVTSQTNFPLLVFDGEWDEKMFASEYDSIFNKDLLADLKYHSIRDLDFDADESGEIYFILSVLSITEMDGEQFESATILYFKRFDGIWKLYKVVMAG